MSPECLTLLTERLTLSPECLTLSAECLTLLAERLTLSPECLTEAAERRTLSRFMTLEGVEWVFGRRASGGYRVGGALCRSGLPPQQEDDTPDVLES